MAQSTSGGRAFKDVISDPAFVTLAKNAQSRICAINEKILVNYGNNLIAAISNKDWKRVYESSTAMRRHIEFMEGCK